MRAHTNAQVHRRISYSASAMALFMALASASPVAAQAPAPDTSAEGGNDSAFNDIVVTARRREENLRDVPVSITYFGGASLEDKGITDFEALVSNAPTLVIQKGSIGPFSFMRGFGAGANLAYEQAVGKLVDGVSYGRDQDNRLPLFDIERVEVLKGPQVLLFGNSSTAGALNISTRKPGDEMTANFSAGYEFNQQEFVTQGGVTLPLSEKASLRVAGFYERLDKGPVYNVTRDTHEATYRNVAGRSILRLNPSDGLEILLKADFAHMRTDGQPLEHVAQPFAPESAFVETELDNIVYHDSNVAPIFGKDFFEMDMKLFQGDVNLDVLGGTLSSTTAYRTADYHWSASSERVAVTNAFIKSDYEQFSQEFRYAASFDNLDVLAGTYLQLDELRPLQAIDFAEFGATLYSNFRQKSRVLSAFGELSYAATPEFTISAGARFSSVRKSAFQAVRLGFIVPGKDENTSRSTILAAISPALDPFFALLAGAPPHTFDNLQETENFFQPQIIAQYEFAPQNMVYAKFVKGAKAGGFDPGYLGPNPEDDYFGAEKTEAYEVGIKGLISGSLDYSIAAFHQNYTDLQLSQLRGVTTIVDNVGKARARGIEVELNWAPVSGLTIGMSGAYLDAKFLNYDIGPCDRATAAATPPGTRCSRDLAGFRTPFSSKWTGAFNIDYEQPISQDYKLGGGISLTGRSGYFPSSNPEPLLYQDGYVQVAAHLDLGPTDDSWTLTLFGRNLTDKQYTEFGAATSGTPGGIAAFRSDGRQIGIRAKVKI